MNNDRSEILYYLKGISCIAVIISHSLSYSLSGSDEAIIKICCFAAPVFYFIAGYYSYNISLDKIKQRLRKITLYGITCFAFYALIEFLISAKFFARGGLLME